jgi:hypothetical protein
MHEELAFHKLSIAGTRLSSPGWTQVSQASSGVTISEIAKVAGVSTATISRILNNRTHGFSKATERKVRAIIETMNWMPNEDAQMLARQNNRKRRNHLRRFDGTSTE